MASEATAPRTASGSVYRFEEGDVELVGREQEVAARSDVVDAVLGGAGGVLFVTGEAGIGKSRLLGEFCRRFEAAGTAGGDPLWLEIKHFLERGLRTSKERPPVSHWPAGM